MITRNTKRALDAAVDELKKDGYMVLVIMLDQKPDSKILSGGLEVLCSHTNNREELSALLKETLSNLVEPPSPERIN